MQVCGVGFEFWRFECGFWCGFRRGFGDGSGRVPGWFTVVLEILAQVLGWQVVSGGSGVGSSPDGSGILVQVSGVYRNLDVVVF